MKKMKFLSTLLALSILASTTASAGNYTVAKGDTLNKIAVTNGTTWEELAQLNHLKNADKIEVGQVLQLSAAFQKQAVQLEAEAAKAEGLTVQVKIPNNFEGTLNGRLLIAFTKTVEKNEPYKQLSATGIPVFGKTFYNLKAGDVVTIDSHDPEVLGFPFAMSELPKGELYVQAFFIKYTAFNRKNAPEIWGMADQGGGGSFKNNPYNLYSEYKLVTIDAHTNQVLSFELNKETPLTVELKDGEVAQQGNYTDTDKVKYVKVKSELLSEFWGTPIYIGANVLLPKNYDSHKKYAALYYQGHWPAGNAPLGYGSNEDFTKFWDSPEAPQMVAITFRDANMFYDTSYSVNSENLGPWGDAIVQELIPYLEKQFNLVDESWARMLSGGSTGGWESLAMQIFYPKFFGGTWSLCPDSVDFNSYQVVNLYKDTNAYYIDKGWFKVERPGSVALNGNVNYMMKDENIYEMAVGGLEATTLGQWAIWEAVYGPMDKDGYPKRVWDPQTGVIDPSTVEFWKENYDLNHYLQQNWATIGKDLVGKIHLRGGDMDAYYLNHAQYLMGDFLESTTAPYYAGYSKTFPQKGHTGNITNMDLLKEMSAQMIQYGPSNAKEVLFGK